MTTNGLLLGAYLDEAESLGTDSLPDGINISLNALDSERFSRITCAAGGGPAEVLPLIDRLLTMHIPVKINCVPVRSFNEEDILPLAALAKDKDITVRFIELMPLGAAAELKFVPGSEIALLLEKTYGALTPFSGVIGSGPAVYYTLPGFAGKIGFINPITHGFCETCNRLRLTSEGFLKLCLSDEIGLDLKHLLRCGVTDEGLAYAIKEIAARKPRFHALSAAYGAFPSEMRHPDSMSKIGG
jgi:cyclic pyranopterin phosphate synthase